MRCGRVTASKFKFVCHADQASPPIRLVMAICHPEISRFKTAAKVWGCQHEKDALDAYKAHGVSVHQDFKVLPSGFIISVDSLYF